MVTFGLPVRLGGVCRRYRGVDALVKQDIDRLSGLCSDVCVELTDGLACSALETPYIHNAFSYLLLDRSLLRGVPEATMPDVDLFRDLAYFQTFGILTRHSVILLARLFMIGMML